MVAFIIDYCILEPKDFVLLCADVIEAEGFKEVHVLEGPGDWKEDICADEILFSQSGIYEVLHFKVQCKHYAKSGKSVSPNEVNEMFPYLFSTDANRLLIVTDTDLTTQAKKEIDSFNKKNPIKKVIYWTRRDLENRLLKHRWIVDKYFPTKAEVAEAQRQINFNPYKLLEFYREIDSEYFFGRNNDINLLAESVYKNKTIILFGESGVGKTSLLHAGLFPLLRQENWLIISTRCLDNPVENIQKEALVQIERLNDERIDINRLKEKRSFDNFLSELSRISNMLELKILVVIDQAEEFFTLCDEDERSTFSSGMTAFLTSNDIHGNFSFLLSVRDDYIGDLRSWARSKVALDSIFSWDGLHNIGRFTLEEARLAVVEPARRICAVYEDLLLEKLLSDLLKIGNGFVYQPYLQIVCSTLFDEALRNAGLGESVCIRTELYERLNGAIGIITSFFSEKLWFGFSRAEQMIARNVAKSLTTSEGLRHQLNLDELADATGEKTEDIVPVLKRLIDKRLVHRVIIEETEQPVYELIHDFLGKQIASQLSNEEKRLKEAEELLAESLRRWNKHDVILSEREITVLKEFRQKLRFTEESMILIFTSILDKSSDLDWLETEKWFECFGNNGIPAFIKAYVGARRSGLNNFDKIVGKWNDDVVDHLITTVISSFKHANEDKKVSRYLALLVQTKNVRVLTDTRLLDFSVGILHSRSDGECVVNALELLMASRKGIEILRNLGDEAIRVMVNTIHDGWYWNGQWYGTATWFDRYAQNRKIFLEISQQNKSLAVGLLQTRIWNSYNARETENLVDVLSLVSNDVQIFRKILLEHWTAYARRAAVRALTEIGSDAAISAIIEGLSSPYSSVLREILIALGRKGNMSALPPLEKLSEDPQLSESNLGYLQKTMQRIRKRQKNRMG